MKRYQGMVLATCLRTTERRADAEDAAQETFFKLARASSAITSNVAAWLHGCAVRTAVDLGRKRRSQARAESGAAGLKAEETGDIGEPAAWAEIRPILDRQIAALSEEDRELIVERFLAGKTEVEMALAAGVSPGTMHRRIDRSLERLRAKLAVAGLGPAGAMAGGLPLGDVLMSAGPAPVQPSLMASLMQVGLAGMPACGVALASGAGAATKFLVVAGIALVVAAAIGGAAALYSAGAGTLMSATGVAPPGPPLPRPTKADGPYPVVSMKVDGKPASTMTIQDRSVRFEKTSGDDVGTGMTLRIESVAKEEKGTGEWKGGSSTTLTVTMLDCNVPDAGPYMTLIGKPLDGRVWVRDDAMELQLKPQEAGGPQGMFRWVGRLAPTTPAKQKPPAKQEPPQGEGAPAPALVGIWEEVSPLSLTIDADDIRLASEDKDMIRFKILEWEDAGGGVARVSTMCVRNVMEQSLIGTRMKLLVRKDEHGYTLAIKQPAKVKVGEAPAGFEPKKGDGVRVVQCREDKR